MFDVSFVDQVVSPHLSEHMYDAVSVGSSSRAYIWNLEVMTNRQTNRFSTCRLDPLRRNFEIDLSWKHLSFEFLLMPSASAALFEFHWGRQSSCLTEYSISEDLVLLGLSRINWKTDELHCITLYWFALEEVWWQRKVDGQGAAQSLLKANAIIIAATNILEY